MDPLIAEGLDTSSSTETSFTAYEMATPESDKEVEILEAEGHTPKGPRSQVAEQPRPEIPSLRDSHLTKVNEKTRGVEGLSVEALTMLPTNEMPLALSSEVSELSGPHLVYLITGANRGIGLGLTAALLQRQNTTVIAAVRDPHHQTAGDLHNLEVGDDSKVIVVKIDSLSHADAGYAAEVLQNYHDIHRIDVVIANAGIGKYYGPAVSTPVDEFQVHFEVNALAPMTLFQAMWPLLKNSEKPKFIAMSSRLASIEGLEFWAGLPGDALLNYMPAAPYGSSKAMLNYLLRRLHFEHEGLIAFPLSPGCVDQFQPSR